MRLEKADVRTHVFCHLRNQLMVSLRACMCVHTAVGTVHDNDYCCQERQVTSAFGQTVANIALSMEEHTMTFKRAVESDTSAEKARLDCLSCMMERSFADMGLIHKAIRLAKSICGQDRADLTTTWYFQRRPDVKQNTFLERNGGGEDTVTNAR